MEYATRDEAQNAIASLSNKELMGRLVYVREVRPVDLIYTLKRSHHFLQDRESEPRFAGQSARGGFDGGMHGGGGRGGFGGGMHGGGGFGGGGQNAGRQLFVNNVSTYQALTSH